MQAAVALLHARLVRPLAGRVALPAWAPGGARSSPYEPPATAARLCAFYLPTLQLALGLLLPCWLVYRREKRQRFAFLCRRGMRPEPLVQLLGCEQCIAAVGILLQLAAMLVLEQSG